MTVMRVEAQKRLMSQRYNTKVRSRQFVKGDLVRRKAPEARKIKDHGKLAAKWEGPFRIRESLGNGAYRLAYLTGKHIPNTWNASHLKFYFS